MIRVLNRICKSLAFADDVVVICQGKVQLNEAITLVEEWSEENRISVNKEKSGILQIRQDRRTPAPSMQTWKGYPIVESYSYLGVTLDDCLKLKIELKARRQMNLQLKSNNHVL